MAEGLTGPDGQALDVERGEQAFAAAMAAPAASNGNGPAAPPRRDADAPYGRRNDGTPRAKPGAKSRSTPEAAARTSKTVPGADRPPMTASEREAGLGGVLQVISMPLIAVPSLRADAGALALHGPGMVTATAAAADADPRLGALVDRLLMVGPYGALLAAGIPLAAQLIRNHAGIPIPGTEDPAELRALIDRQLDRQAEAAEAAEAEGQADTGRHAAEADLIGQAG